MFCLLRFWILPLLFLLCLGLLPVTQYVVWTRIAQVTALLYSHFLINPHYLVNAYSTLITSWLILVVFSPNELSGTAIVSCHAAFDSTAKKLQSITCTMCIIHKHTNFFSVHCTNCFVCVLPPNKKYECNSFTCPRDLISNDGHPKVTQHLMTRLAVL